MWNLPYAKHASNWLARNALGGWQISAVTQAQSGQPFSITDDNDYAGMGPGAGSQLWAPENPAHMGRHFGSGGRFDANPFENPDGTPAHPPEGTGWET